MKEQNLIGRRVELSRKQPLVKILDALRMTDELEFDIQADKKIDVEKKN